MALAQINPTVGDVRGNTKKIIEFMGRAREEGASIIAFPELSIPGYPPEDLILKPQFIADNLKGLDEVRAAADGIVAVVGFVDRGRDVFNAAAVLSDRKVVDVYHKMYLPNYGVFDEMRYFQAGTVCPVYEMGDFTFGVTICEDIWYPTGPARTQALKGAEVIININGSPYTIGKNEFRRKMLATRSSDSGAIIVYVNMASGQDELVFDGGSLVMDERGRLAASCGLFREQLLTVDLDLESVFMWRLHDPRMRQERLMKIDEVKTVSFPPPRRAAGQAAAKKIKKTGPAITQPPGPEEEIYTALGFGLSDYVMKNGFKEVVIGLSGGIDSALVAVIAADFLGNNKVHTVFMPSRFTSAESREDSYELAKNLGVSMAEIPIDPVFDQYLAALDKSFKDTPPNTAEENLQARVRGNILMALSNKFGYLVVTTGNKSEMSVGYATLYGDMAGGFALIKDVPKTLVYRLSRWRNSKKPPVIPERIITKAPTAELRPDQKDTDSLPPYDVLDPILAAYVEEERSFEEMLALSYPPEDLKRVIRMVDASEYKRRQSPPGIKITPRAFGRDRRFPITNKYKSY